jgi:hypothetical protein
MASGSKFSKFGANLVDLELAWKDRLEDAHALLAANRHASTIAMGLYSLEILLKTLICKKLDLEQLPTPFEIHDLDGLLVLSGLDRRLGRLKTSRVKFHWDGILNTSVDINNLRYKPNKNWTATDARDLLSQLDDPTDGVIAWLLNQP